ncbi:hypothetical protein CR513_37430, partial [Mucuna pruriens]
MQKILYASVVGSLMYAQVCTHPNIAFVVGVLGQAVKRMMRYLKRTKRYMLIYRKSKGLKIISLRVVNGIERQLKIYCGNNLAVLYSNNNRSSTKSKSIDIKLLVVKERVHNKQISIKHIETSFMLTDSLIKGLIPKVFHEHIAHMGDIP